MFKRLYLWLMLGASTAALLGCGGGNSVDAPPFDPPSCEGADASSDGCLPPPPPPNPCDVTPQPAECVTDRISITSPAANSLWAQPEMNLVVAFSAGVPADLALTLNGQDIASSATINDDEARIVGTAIETLLVHGDNTFEAKTGTETEKVTFVYDLKVPHIIVTTAVEATTNSVEQNPGDTLKVSGLVRDVASIDSVTINGVEATLSGNDFVVEIPHSNIYRITATDSHGQSGSLDFAAPQHRLEPLLAMQINDSIFTLIQPIINDVFANLDTSSMVDPALRIPFNNSELAITRLDVNKGGAPSIDMHFLPSATESLAIEVTVDMPLVGMGLQAFGAAAIDPSMDIDLDIANIGVTMQLAVSNDELNQLRLGLGSAAPFNLALGGITINHFNCRNIDAVCTTLASAANQAFNNPAFLNLLLNVLNQNVGPMLADILADIELPSVPLNVPLDTNGDGTQDTQLSMDIAPSLLTTGTQGNAYIEMAGSMYVANNQLPAGFKGALGSVYVDAGPVPAFASATESGKEYDLGIALPSNFLNQAFLSLYQTGVMSSIAMEILPADLGSMGALLGTVGVGPDDTMRMRLLMGSVPYMQLSHANLAVGRTAGIVMHLDNTVIYMDVKKAGETDYSVLLGMVADISANLELGIDADNYIDLGVDNLVNMDVISLLPEGIGAPGSPLAGVMTPAIIESQIGPAVKNMLKTDTLPGMLKKTLEIAITMADESNVPLQLPLNLGMIMRELSVDASDAYMVIKIDLLDDNEIENSTENVPFRINIGKRPPVTEVSPAP